MTEWKVPLFDLDLGQEEYESVKEVMDSKWLTMGQITKEFESAFAEYLGVKHAIAVNSGTAAMHLAHHAMGLTRGDEVICPSLTFVATANAAKYTGATPIFADISCSDDFNISPDEIESRINERTKGIVVVHYAGFPCDMDRIMDIAARHDLYVVEDAAHAVGAKYNSSKLKAQSSKQENGERPGGHSKKATDNGQQRQAHGERSPVNSEPIRAESSKLKAERSRRKNGAFCKVGTIGDVGCFSFFGNKNMTTGEGGMVVTNSDDLAEKIGIARSHGMTTLTWDRYSGHSFSYDVVGPGFNYRIDEIRSGLGLVQLGKLDRNNRRRRYLWELYRESLHGIEEIAMPFSQSNGISAYHIFPLLVSERIDRKAFMEYLGQGGIQTSIHYPAVHLFSYYKNLVPPLTCLPATEDVGRREVTLPLFPTMTEEQLTYVVKTIKDYLSQSPRRSLRDTELSQIS